MITIFSQANIATITNGTIENGAMAVEDDKIIWFGTIRELPNEIRLNAKKIINCKNRYITPGLIDCHTHIVYAGNRSDEFARRLQGETYSDIANTGGGIAKTVNATRQASFDELFSLSLPRVKHLINEGVTTIEIKSGYGLDKETELKMLCVAKELEKILPITVKKTFLGAHAKPPEFDNLDNYIDYICNEVLPEAGNLVDAVDIFCENIAFNNSHVIKLFDKAQELNKPVKIHAEQLSNQNGATLAAKYKALSADHLEYLTEDSIKAMRDNNTVATLLPGAFYFLKETKLPPIDLLRKYNAPIAIATDSNPGSSPTCSLLLMLNMACVLFGLTFEEAINGVTINAAKALGVESEVGSIEVGKKADFVIWDINSLTDLAYNYGYNPYKEVYKNGTLIKQL